MVTFFVLGGYGEMGKISVLDLFETTKDEIIVAGRDLEKAQEFAQSFKSSRIKAVQADASDIDDLAEKIKGCDVVLNCAQYYFNLNVMEACLKAGVNYLDLGGLFHTTLKQLKLHEKFKEKKLIGILGCGSTPGITNIMAGYGAKQFDKIEEIKIRFAGKDHTDYGDVPFVVPYSIQTIFDEFTLKPAVLENGKIKLVKPMYGKETYNFPKPIGKQACFSTLHSELATFPKSFGLKNCSFKLSFPEDFVSKVKFLIDTGMASQEKIKFGEYEISPREFSVRLLNKFLPPQKIKVKDEEMVVVELIGKSKGKNKKLRVICHAKSNPRWNVASGAIDTGIPPSIIAQMIAKCEIPEVGVLAPELCINPDMFFKELRKRGMRVFVE